MKQAIARMAAAALALVGLAAGAANAPADTPAQYAYHQPLTVSGRQAVVQYRLPRNVYLHALSAELHDVRVFDADGKLLPFALRAPFDTAQASSEDVPVRVFPVFGQPGEQGIDAGVEIRRARDGTVISVEARSGGVPAAGPVLSALVLDMGGSGTFDALHFALPPETRRYEARLGIEVSDDLKRWRGIAESEVGWMTSNDGQSLANDRISFEPQQFRYARIRWLEGSALQFAGIRATAVRHSEVAAPVETMLVQPVSGRAPNDLLYRTAPAIPVQRLGLQFTERNISLPAALGRYREVPALRGGRSTAWQFEPVVGATFYRFEQSDRERIAGDVTIAPQHGDHWVVRVLTASDSKPALRLGWSPATLVFLANGRAPYTLAYGRRDARPAAWELEQVAPGLSETELGNVEHAAGAAERAAAPPVAPAPVPSAAAQAAGAATTRKSILWSTLALGVAVLAVMAWQLYRQLK